MLFAVGDVATWRVYAVFVCENVMLLLQTPHSTLPDDITAFQFMEHDVHDNRAPNPIHPRLVNNNIDSALASLCVETNGNNTLSVATVSPATGC